MAAANSTSTAGSVGALARDLPGYAVTPPVEAVVFAWGEREGGGVGETETRFTNQCPQPTPEPPPPPSLPLPPTGAAEDGQLVSVTIEGRGSVHG